MLLIPIMKTISIHSLCVFVRQHDQENDDEPVIVDFSSPSNEDDAEVSLGRIDDLKASSSDPFTGMEASVFDLRIKRVSTSLSGISPSAASAAIRRKSEDSTLQISANSNVTNSDAAATDKTNRGISVDYDYAYDFDAHGRHQIANVHVLIYSIVDIYPIW